VKICSKECNHCQPFNESWCVCWHKKIKASKVQMGIQCTVEKIKEDQINRIFKD
jgi:hypothetical protein